MNVRRLVSPVLALSLALAPALPPPAAGAGAPAPDAHAAALPVEPEGQQENLWCWAASTRIILDYLRLDAVDPERCEEATLSANEKRAELHLCCGDEKPSSVRAAFCAGAEARCGETSVLPDAPIDCCSAETPEAVRTAYCNEDLRQCAQATVRANKRRESRAKRPAAITLSPALGAHAKGTIAPVDLGSGSYARRSAPIDCCDPETVASWEGYWDCNAGGFPEFEDYGFTASSSKCPCRLTMFSEATDLAGSDPAAQATLDRLLADPAFLERAAATDSTSRCLKLLVAEGVVSRERLDRWRDALDLDAKLAAAEDCALAWPVLRREIDAGRPLAFSWRYAYPNSGHMMVAAGYAVTSPAGRWVLVVDPLPPGNGDYYLVPYDYYVDGPVGRHWRDYWEIRREGEATGATAIAPLVVRPSLSGSAPEAAPADRDACRLEPSEIEAARGAAAAGLAAVEALATGAAEFALALGFGMAEAFFLGGEVRPLEDGLALDQRPLAVCELGLDELAAWKKDGTVRFHPPEEMVWPIVRRGDDSPFRHYGVMTLRRAGEGWRLASLGRKLGMSVELGDLFAAGAEGGGRDPLYVLSVPDLYQLYLAYPDRLEPVYPADFFPPNSPVTAGSYETVFRQLETAVENFASPLGDPPEGQDGEGEAE